MEEKKQGEALQEAGSASSGESELKAREVLKKLLEYSEAAKGLEKALAPLRRIQARGPTKPRRSTFYVALPQLLGKLFLERTDKVYVIVESLEEKDGKLEARLLLRQA